MPAVVPVLAEDALNHDVILEVLGIGVRPRTSAVLAAKVLVVFVQLVHALFLRLIP